MNKWKIGWGIINSCNMNCSFCYSITARKSEELHFNILTSFVDNNFKNIDSINYGTSENTLSERWFDLLLYISANYPNIPQAITTNGHLSHAVQKKSPKRITKILSALNEVDISLDFADPDKHNHFRGHNKAYNWVIDTIRLCRDANIPTTLVMLGVNSTLELENVKKIFEIASKFQCFVRINIFRPNDMQKIEPPDYKQLKNTLLWIVKNKKIVSLSDPLFSALILDERRDDYSGTKSLRILPDGSVTPSTYLVSEKWRKANIKNISLDNNLSLIMLGDSNYLSENIPIKCNGCIYQNKCRGGALDRRIIWFDNVSFRDPYCPVSNKDEILSWRSELKDDNKINGPSIHDGYLPTLIFSP